MMLDSLSQPLHAALYFAIFYFSAALLTGVWKWRAMLAAPDGRAHPYVDIAHHAALHYGPFIVLAGALGSFWPFGDTLPAWVLVDVMGWTMVLSLCRYIRLGLRRTTANQLRTATAPARIGLFFFFFGSVLPGLVIAFGAAVSLWPGLPGTPF